MRAEDHEADEQGADDHGVMHGAGVPVGHAALRGLRKAEDADADKHPEGEGEGLGHGFLGAGRRDESGIDILERHDALLHAAARLDDGQQDDDHGHDHDDSLNGVCQDDCPESADSGVQHHTDSEEDQSDNVRIACHALEKAGTSDELREHGRHEEDDECHGTQDDHGVAFESGPQVIRDGYRLCLPGHDGEPLAEDAQGQECGGHLNHGEQYPAQAEPVCHARTADETAGAGVACDNGHGQHEAAHGRPPMK